MDMDINVDTDMNIDVDINVDIDSILAVKRGFKVSLGTVGGIEAVMVLTLKFLK